MRHVYMKDMRHVQMHLVMSCSCEMFDVRFLHLSGGRVGIVHSLTVHGLIPTQLTNSFPTQMFLFEPCFSNS